jgi:kumamolisin
MAEHAPAEADFELVKAWLVTRGMHGQLRGEQSHVDAVLGDVKDFNQTFATTLHICMRKNPQQGNPPFPVYCTLGGFTLPKFVAERTTGLLTADLPADPGAAGRARGRWSRSRRTAARSPARIAVAYEFKD